MNTTSVSRFKLHLRDQGQAMTAPIHYATGTCALGALLVARSGQGICAILLDDQDKGLREQVAKAFPGAVLEENSGALQQDLASVAAFIETPAESVPFDLDIGGTLFQQRVWHALREIPAGQTRTYTEVARHIGAPAAVRAVAGACAANVLAVVIPCHRVVRQDGSSAGFRWGVERKRALLQREKELG